MKAPKNTKKYLRRRTYTLITIKNSDGIHTLTQNWRCVHSNQYYTKPADKLDLRNDNYVSHYLSQKSSNKTSKNISTWIQYQ